MRAAMMKKPLHYRREYFEVSCTSAEKLYIQYRAMRRNLSFQDYVHQQLTEHIRKIEPGFNHEAQLKEMQKLVREEIRSQKRAAEAKIVGLEKSLPKKKTKKA